MPGTSDDPVRLDPFQNIVEVGWRNDPPTHVAVAMSITTWVYWSGFGEFCDIDGARDPTEGKFHAFDALDRLEFDRGGGGLAGAYRPDVPAKWVGDGGAGGVIEGLPDVDAEVSLPPYTWVLPTGIFTNQESLGGSNWRIRHYPAVINQSFWCRMDWDDVSGAPILDSNGDVIMAPGSSVPFAAVTTATYQARGLDSAETSPVCTKVFGPSVANLALEAFDDSVPTGWLTSYGLSGNLIADVAQTLDFSSVAVTIGDHAYRAVGLAVPLSEISNPVIQNTGAIYVLCALDEPTA